MNKQDIKNKLVANGLDKSKFSVKKVHGVLAVVFKSLCDNIEKGYKITIELGLTFYVNNQTFNYDVLCSDLGFKGDTVKRYRELCVI